MGYLSKGDRITSSEQEIIDVIGALGSGLQILRTNAGATNVEWATAGAGVGTVTAVSVASANGFAGTVANANSTPAITLSTSITGVLKGNGTSISAATAGTDYAVGSTGLSGGQTIAGSTLTTENLTLRANAADLTTGQVNVTSSKEATNTTTASVAIAGGLAVAKRIYSLDMTVTNTITGSVSGNAGTASAVAVGGITGLGTNVATALAVNVGSAGAFIVLGGALGTPSSGTATNITGLPAAAVLAGSFGTGAYVMDSSLQVSTIELGHATQNTLSASGGVLSVEGVAVLTVAGGTLTGSITLGENTSIALDPAGSADGKYTGITIAGTAGTALTFGDLCYLAVADSRWELCDADAIATSGHMLGMCVLAAGADGNATTMLLLGVIRSNNGGNGDFPALTVGAPVYVGEAAGKIQVAIPTGADAVIRVVGFALTTEEIYFNPSQDNQTVVA